MSSIFIFGSGASTLAKKGELAGIERRDSLAFGHAFKFFIDHMKWFPTYWTFVDPHSTIASLQTIIAKKVKIRTKLLLLGDVTHTSLANFRKHGFGQPQKSPKFDFLKDGYQRYQKLLDQASQFLTIEEVPVRSYMSMFGTDKERFPENCHSMVTDRSAVPLLYVGKHILYDKLHVVGLPICVYLGYTEVYILGFDGLAGRFLDGPNVLKRERKTEGKLCRSYNYIAPLWNQWKEELGMEIYSLAGKDHTVLANHFPVVDIKTAIDRTTPFFSTENLKKTIHGT